MNSLAVRIAQPEHAEILSHLVNSAYRGASSQKGWTTEAHLLGGQRINPLLLEKEIRQHTILGIVIGDEWKACVSLHLIHPKDQNKCYCYLGMLTVEPTCQNQGMGKRLLEESEHFARKQGAKSLRMSVIHLRSELIAWYERRGYKKTGETAPFPYSDENFGIPKREDLYFVILEKPL